MVEERKIQQKLLLAVGSVVRSSQILQSSPHRPGLPDRAARQDVTPGLLLQASGCASVYHTNADSAAAAGGGGVARGYDTDGSRGRAVAGRRYSGRWPQPGTAVVILSYALCMLV